MVCHILSSIESLSIKKWGCLTKYEFTTYIYNSHTSTLFIKTLGLCYNPSVLIKIILHHLKVSIDNFSKIDLKDCTMLLHNQKMYL